MDEGDGREINESIVCGTGLMLMLYATMTERGASGYSINKFKIHFVSSITSTNMHFW